MPASHESRESHKGFGIPKADEANKLRVIESQVFGIGFKSLRA